MTDRIFKRKIYAQMLEWKQKKQGKTALLIRGARRVGKSTIAEQFAKQEYKSYILIDFNKARKDVVSLFDDLNDLSSIFRYLQQYYRVALYERQSVIVFDEVQRCPAARQAIKYLVADGRYDYIETGSLISIRKNTQGITIPSEETRLDMYPIDFEEFLWARGDEVTIPLLRSSYIARKPLGNGLHRQLMRDFRLYMLVGGMPQAINTLIDTNNFGEVDATKREILDLYCEDFHKIDPTGKAELLFRAIPAQLMSNATRYQVSTVLKDERASTISEIVAEMKESMTVNVVYHSNDPNVGMLMSQDIYTYKLFLADTGLFISLAFRDKRFVDNFIYNKLLSDKLEANLGYVYENIVAQMLRAAGYELFYYTFPKDEKHNYEVDFLLSQGNKIVPIEVKSSGYKAHKSLDAFSEKFRTRIGQRLLIYTKDYQQDENVTYLPMYMAALL